MISSKDVQVAVENILGYDYNIYLVRLNFSLSRRLKCACEKAFLEKLEGEDVEFIRKAQIYLNEGNYFNTNL